MKHSREDYNRIQDPLNLIGENEPVFLLRAKDVNMLRMLVTYRDLVSGSSPDDATTKELVDSLEQHINLVRNYQNTYGAKQPDLADTSKMQQINQSMLEVAKGKQIVTSDFLKAISLGMVDTISNATDEFLRKEFTEIEKEFPRDEELQVKDELIMQLNEAVKERNEAIHNGDKRLNELIDTVNQRNEYIDKLEKENLRLKEEIQEMLTKKE